MQFLVTKTVSIAMNSAQIQDPKGLYVPTGDEHWRHTNMQQQPDHFAL